MDTELLWYRLIDFNGISTYVGLFYVKSLVLHVHIHI